MAKRENISSSVIRRLPRYYRFLRELDAMGVTHVSSGELAKRMRSTASQVRQDLNCFGEFGQQGIGYNVAMLRDVIEDILGIKSLYPAILIGAGNIGLAIANQVIFEGRCFELIGIFDKDTEKIGKTVGELKIQDIDELKSFCDNKRVSTAILCVPKSAVEPIAETLCGAGVRSFWNFSHYDLNMKFDNVIVENVHLSDSLMQLCFRLKKQNND